MFPNDTFYSNDKSNSSTSKNGIPKYRQNSNLFENNERTMNSMGFNPLDLGPFNSGAQIAAAAVNGLFQGSNNNGFSMSDFENNPNGIGSSKSNSGLDTVSSSPVSDQISLAFGIENTSLSHTNSNNSGVFNPLLNNGSNFDSLIHAPSSLNRNSNGSFMNNNSTDLNGASSTGSFMDNVNGNNSFDDSKLTFNGIPMSSNTTSSSSFNNADGISPPTTIRRSSSINSKNHINHHHSNGGTNHKAPHGNNNHHHSHSSLIHPYLSTSLSRTKSNSSTIGSPVLKSAESSSPTVRSSSFLNDTVSLFDNIKNFSNQT
ncbi:unnamed protein product [[Candida] boidinii]|nr:unnamed protein product [[Candida] boidinii]